MNKLLILMAFFFVGVGVSDVEGQASPQLCYHGITGELQNTTGARINVAIRVRFNQPSYYIQPNGAVAIASPTETILTINNQIGFNETYTYGGAQSGPGFYSEFAFVIIDVSATVLESGAPATVSGSVNVVGSNFCISLDAAQGMPVTGATANLQPSLRTASQQGLIVPMGDDGRAASLPERSLDIWGIDARGRGYLAMRITARELERLPEAPAENLIIREVTGAGFYLLTTGEYQVNFGPSADGWVDVVVFTREMRVTNTYRWNINEAQ